MLEIAPFPPLVGEEMALFKFKSDERDFGKQKILRKSKKKSSKTSSRPHWSGFRSSEISFSANSSVWQLKDRDSDKPSNCLDFLVVLEF